MKTLVLESSFDFENGLTAAIDDGAICISVQEEQAVDSYNCSFDCSIHLTIEQVVTLKEWLEKALKRSAEGKHALLANAIDPIWPRSK